MLTVLDDDFDECKRNANDDLMVSCNVHYNLEDE